MVFHPRNKVADTVSMPSKQNSAVLLPVTVASDHIPTHNWCQRHREDRRDYCSCNPTGLGIAVPVTNGSRDIEKTLRYYCSFHSTGQITENEFIFRHKDLSRLNNREMDAPFSPVPLHCL